MTYVRADSIKHQLTRNPSLEKKNQVGKVIYGNRYLHKKYSNQLDRVKYNKALNAMRRDFPNHKFNIIKYNKFDGKFSFIDSPDFDTSKNPIVGDVVTVSRSGSTRLTSEREHPQIYHLKYLFVDPSDYKGFPADKFELQVYKDTVKERPLTRREFRRLQEIASRNSDKTRIANKNPSTSAMIISNEYKRDMNVIDFGAGDGRSTRYLRRKGFKVTSYDPYKSKSKSVEKKYDKRKHYDIAFSDYVGNTLTDSERNKWIEDLSKINYDVLYIAVRSEKQIENQRKNNPNNYLLVENGGYFVINRGTYQKGFTDNDLKKYGKILGTPRKIKSDNDKVVYQFTK